VECSGSAGMTNFLDTSHACRKAVRNTCATSCAPHRRRSRRVSRHQHASDAQRSTHRLLNGKRAGHRRRPRRARSRRGRVHSQEVEADSEQFIVRVLLSLGLRQRRDDGGGHVRGGAQAVDGVGRGAQELEQLVALGLGTLADALLQRQRSVRLPRRPHARQYMATAAHMVLCTRLRRRTHAHTRVTHAYTLRAFVIVQDSAHTRTEAGGGARARAG
jgi:hypothetical protein